MKKRFSNEQIVAVLQRHSNGEKAKDLELENSRLKRLVANMALDIEAQKDINSRKW